MAGSILSFDWLRRASIALILSMGVASTLAAQSVDPHLLQFSASPDHYAMTTGNLPLVTKYTMAWYPVGASIPDLVFDLGKPVPDAQGTVAIDLTTRLAATPPKPGVTYVARVAAVGPTGSSAGLDSNPFIFSAQCTYAVSPTAVGPAAIAGSGPLTIATGASCGWSALSNDSWLSVDRASGTGPATITLNVAANTAPTPRVGSILVAGVTIIVTQAGANCTFSLSTTTLGMAATAGTANIGITSPAGCAWTSGSATPWITVSPNAGVGSQTVSVAVAANTATAPRTGTVSVVNQTITINQAAASGTVLVTDTFTGADGMPLSAHAPNVNVPGGGWTITGGLPLPALKANAAGIAAGTGHVQATINVGVADVRVGADVKVSTGNFLAAIVLRLVDANNHLLFVASSGSLQLYRKQAGEFTLVTSQPVTNMTAGTTHRLEARATGSTVEAWWDNAPRFVVTESFQQSATRHGIDWNSAYDANSTFDNFEVRASGALPPPPGVPATPSPGNLTTGAAPIALTWTSANATGYTVAFGTSNPPPKVTMGLSSASYAPVTAPGTTYFWQITAVNPAGSTTGPVWTFTVAAAPSGLLVRDTFTGANGTALTAHAPDVALPGVPWVVTGGEPAPKLSNNAVGISAGTGHLQATLNAGTADVRVGVDVRIANGNFLSALALRFVDANNHLLIVAYSGSLQLYRKQAGFFTLLASQPIADMAPTTTHRLEARATGSTIEAWWDNFPRFSLSESFQRTATRHGIDWNSAYDAATVLDNFELRAIGGQTPPGTPSTPSPINLATGVSSPTLTWSASNATSYTLAFGTINPPAPVATGLANTSYTPAIAPNTTYYWQVIASNANGSTTGPIWSFTTRQSASAF